MKVPSGQSVAKAMKLPVLKPTDLADLAFCHLDERTPLWFYIAARGPGGGRRAPSRTGRWPDRGARCSTA